MTDQRFTGFLEQAEERGCIELSALNEFSQSLELDEPEVEELYEEVESRGIELADDCGQYTPETVGWVSRRCVESGARCQSRGVRSAAEFSAGRNLSGKH